jgi:hypothetical protein
MPANTRTTAFSLALAASPPPEGPIASPVEATSGISSPCSVATNWAFPDRSAEHSRPAEGSPLTAALHHPYPFQRSNSRCSLVARGTHEKRLSSSAEPLPSANYQRLRLIPSCKNVYVVDAGGYTVTRVNIVSRSTMDLYQRGLRANGRRHQRERPNHILVSFGDRWVTFSLVVVSPADDTSGLGGVVETSQ